MDIVIVIAIFVALVVFAIVAGRIAARKRREAIAQVFAQRRGQVAFDLTDDDRTRASAAAPFLARLGQGLRSFEISGLMPVGGTAVSLVTHRYTTGSGKNTSTHHTAVASIPCPPAWPELTLNREGFFHKIADLLGFKDIELEDSEFNAKWRVKSADENFALLLLSPEIQAWLKTLPGSATFRVGSGVLAAVLHREIRPDEIATFVELPVEFRARVLPEVDAYTGSPAR